MHEFFWESIQRARKEYLCNTCHNRIERGQVYKRTIWTPRGGNIRHVLREHSEPDCPFDFETELMAEVEQKHALIPIALEVRIKEVVLVQINGSTITRQEPEIVPVIISPAAPDDNMDDGLDLDDDNPF